MSLRVDAATTLGALSLEIDLEVAPGSCLAIAGPSGAGKSSSLRIAAGLLTPQRGRVTSNEQVWLDTERSINRRPEQRRCGYVFQDYALFPHLSAWQNVAYAVRDQPRREREAVARDWLVRFGLDDRGEARPATLSGGECQRVALARALARRPDVLLLDEPLSALDARSRASASRQLRAVLSDTGVPTILVTHDFTEAALLGDEVAIVDQGRIVQQGTATALAAQPANAFVADFAGAVVLHGDARREQDGTTIVTLAGGQQLRSTDAATGPVAATVFPWEITIGPGGRDEESSTQNLLEAQIVSMTTIGGRVRLSLSGPESLVAEVSTTAVDHLRLQPGSHVSATWKATATRLVPDA